MRMRAKMMTAKNKKHYHPQARMIVAPVVWFLLCLLLWLWGVAKLFLSCLLLMQAFKWAGVERHRKKICVLATAVVFGCVYLCLVVFVCMCCVCVWLRCVSLCVCVCVCVSV